MTLDRRGFVQGIGIGALAFEIGGLSVMLTPREARAAAVRHRVLSAAEVETLEAVGETLLPGARDAGIAPFVDGQLAVEPAQSLLMIRYLDVPPPYLDFYRPVLAAIDAAAGAAHGRRFAALEPEQAIALVSGMSSGEVTGWSGPPARLAYFVLRSDAVDVVYGTVEGFEALGIPYMPHIMPTRPW